MAESCQGPQGGTHGGECHVLMGRDGVMLPRARDCRHHQKRRRQEVASFEGRGEARIRTSGFRSGENAAVQAPSVRSSRHPQETHPARSSSDSHGNAISIPASPKDARLYHTS